MSTNTHIQMHFPHPGEWGNFLLTALWTDAEGYDCRRSYQPTEIPPEYVPTLQRVVNSLVSLGAPWQATHVTAVCQHSASMLPLPVDEENETEQTQQGEASEAVELAVDARRADGACRHLTSADYPQLRLESSDALAFFRGLTGA